MPTNAPAAAFSPDSPLVARVTASPNHDARALPIDMIVMHYTGMPSADAALTRLCDPAAKVSSHYMVFEDGTIAQLVPEARRAWHAGVSSWHRVTDINSCSIGIEIANPGHDFGYPDFPDVQIDAVIALTRGIIARHRIAIERVVAHSDIAPERKNDPGEKFPWQRLSAAGCALWLEPSEIIPGPELDPGDQSEIVTTLQNSLAELGYGLAATGTYDALTQAVVTAFQRRFRPGRVDGIADHSTFETIKRVLAAVSPQE
jgi:N-acetylmuramoyl-L-alanine amidase